MSNLETYAAYLRLLPGLVQTVLGLAESVKRLAREDNVAIPDVDALRRANDKLRDLPDLAASSASNTATNAASGGEEG